MTLWAGAGVSGAVSAYEAGRQAARAACEGRSPSGSGLVLAFASSHYAQEELLAGIRSVTGDTPLAGCSAPAQITAEGAVTRSVSLLLMEGDGIEFAVGAGRGVAQDARHAGQQAARAALQRSLQTKRFFLMFPDGISGGTEDVIRGAQEVLGTSFPIVGGSAGDDLRFRKAFQYCDGQVLTDSIVGVLLGNRVALGIGVRHGWIPLGKPRIVTEATANHVRRLDGQPAVGLYEEYFGGATHRFLEGPMPRVAISYPLGIRVPGEEECLVRNAVWVDARGGLLCGGEVPEGAELHLMLGSKESCLQAARQAAERALRLLLGRRVRAALVLDSAARRHLLGRLADGEIRAVREVLGPEVVVAGCYTFGEQAPLGAERYLGRAYVHNETVVILAVGE